MAENKSRIYYLDCLRVFSIFGVMLIHIIVQLWHDLPVTGFCWQTLNAYDSLLRWCVPVFVMISGALFLGRDIPLKTIFSKYILRIVTAFLTWSALYAVWDVLRKGGGIRQLATSLIGGHYHMWFCFMIVGLYLAMPLLRKIVVDETLTRYFIVLSFFFALAIPQAIQLIGHIRPDMAENINSLLGNVDLHIPLGYVGYFVTGYYLSRVTFTRREKTVIYLLAAACLLITALGTALLSVRYNEPLDWLYGYKTVNTAFPAVAMFILLRSRGSAHGKHSNRESLMCRLAEYSFGAYLVHAFLIELCAWPIQWLLTKCAIVTLPVIGVVIFILSYGISAVLHRIPIVKKYMV